MFLYSRCSSSVQAMVMKSPSMETSPDTRAIRSGVASAAVSSSSSDSTFSSGSASISPMLTREPSSTFGVKPSGRKYSSVYSSTLDTRMLR